MMCSLTPHGPLSLSERQQNMVLVVDSNPDMRQVLADSLSLLPCPVIQASTEEQALECLHRYAPVLVVTKWRMAGGGLPHLGACPSNQR
jgi:CheY-like chemotaxis protein